MCSRGTRCRLALLDKPAVVQILGGTAEFGSEGV